MLVCRHCNTDYRLAVATLWKSSDHHMRAPPLCYNTTYFTERRGLTGKHGT